MDNLSHLDICKPLTKQSPIYCLTVEFIQDCLEAVAVENETLKSKGLRKWFNLLL